MTPWTIALQASLSITNYQLKVNSFGQVLRGNGGQIGHCHPDKSPSSTQINSDCWYLVLSCSVVSNSCDPMDRRPPGFAMHWILQAKTLEWVAMPSSRESSLPRDWTCVSCIFCIGRRILYQLSHRRSSAGTLPLVFSLSKWALYLSLWCLLPKPVMICSQLFTPVHPYLYVSTYLVLMKLETLLLYFSWWRKTKQILPTPYLLPSLHGKGLKTLLVLDWFARSSFVGTVIGK